MLKKTSILIIALIVCQFLFIAGVNGSRVSERQNLGKIIRKKDVPIKLTSLRYNQPYESIDSQNRYTMTRELVDPVVAAANNLHKESTKGWLDMGAWTKKKGAFGWYADFPVGGKGR